jgi:hypothetical protein
VPEGFLSLGGRTKFVIGTLVATILITDRQSERSRVIAAAAPLSIEPTAAS